MLESRAKFGLSRSLVVLRQEVGLLLLPAAILLSYDDDGARLHSPTESRKGLGSSTSYSSGCIGSGISNP